MKPRPSASVLAVLVVAALLVPGPAGAKVKWRGDATMIGGTSTYDAGEWIYQDFVYDDYGADTQAAGANQIVSLAGTSGDFRYPTDGRYGHNAADIAEVRLQRHGRDLEVRVTMNTLIDEGTTVLGVGLAGEEDEAAAQPWPFGAGVTSVWSRFVTVADGVVHDTGAAGPGSSAVDLGANTIDFTIPDVGEGFGIAIGSGLWDAENGEWLAGASGNEPSEGTYSTGGATDVRVFDLAFNSRELEPRAANWMEDAQSDALASGDVSAFTQDVELGSKDAFVLETGAYYNRLFRSIQTHVAEGVNPDGFPQFNGLYQPYGLWIPHDYDPDAPSPLVLLLHSLSVHHNQYAGGALGESFRTLYEQFDDPETGLNAVMVTPLGRGPDGWYTDEGLVDTFEVWEDVRANYHVDDERTHVSGYSMGGYGTYRLGTLLPDRFASAVTWVGPPANGIWAYPLEPFGSQNTYDQLESVEHVPYYIVAGTNDELVPVSGVTHQANRFHELGHEYRYALHPGQDHLSFVFVDSWTRERDWMKEHPERVTQPAHVAYDARPAFWASSDVSDEILGYLDALGVPRDSAYWVRDVQVAGDGDVTGVVDLTSGGLRDPVTRADEILRPEAGVLEESPTTPYLLRGIDRVTLENRPGAGDVLMGSLSGVSALTIDVGRAGLSDSPTLDIETDTPVTLTFLRDGAVVGSATVG